MREDFCDEFVLAFGTKEGFMKDGASRLPAMTVPRELCSLAPRLREALARLDGPPRLDEAEAGEFLQRQILCVLFEHTEWVEWVESLQRELEARPYVRIGAGLGVCADCEGGRRLLLGLSLSCHPGCMSPPYDIGRITIGTVMRSSDSADASAESHSTNELPAPPHTAGFFERVPPLANAFACVRPHPRGGGETIVVDSGRVVSSLCAQHERTLRTRPYTLRTSARLGGEKRPFTVLEDGPDGRPFLRYRASYTEPVAAADDGGALAALAAAVDDPANCVRADLAADEVLIQSNGCPHGRLPMRGAGADAEAGTLAGEPPQPAGADGRRKLIRCRVQPRRGWAERFDRADSDPARASAPSAQPTPPAKPPRRTQAELQAAVDAAVRAGAEHPLSDALLLHGYRQRYALEFDDEHHRFFRHLQLYHDEWERLGRPEPGFFGWLDPPTGARPAPSLADCPREALDGGRILYLRSEEERRGWRVEIGGGGGVAAEGVAGELRVAGSPLDTSDGEEGQYMFVLSPRCELYAGAKRRGTVQHTTFLGGGPCIACGYLKAERGVLLEVSPDSGHYRPDGLHMYHLLLALRAAGARLSETRVDMRRLVRPHKDKAPWLMRAADAVRLLHHEHGDVGVAAVPVG